MTLEAEEIPGEPEDGDIYCCADGSHVGTVDPKFLNGSVGEILHIQIFQNDNWYIYQLHAVQPLGEEDVAGKDQADSTKR